METEKLKAKNSYVLSAITKIKPQNGASQSPNRRLDTRGEEMNCDTALKMTQQQRDQQFRAQLASGEWPMDSCDACLQKYWACNRCGTTCLGDESRTPTGCADTWCPAVDPVWKETRVCCQRYNHNVGDCCLHCGRVGAE